MQSASILQEYTNFLSFKRKIYVELVKTVS